MKVIYVRGSDELHAYLLNRAARNRRSLSQEVRSILEAEVFAVHQAGEPIEHSVRVPDEFGDDWGNRV